MDAFEDVGASIVSFSKLSTRMCLGNGLRPAPVWATTYDSSDLL